jgi:PPP family 3-phenylpropionic acid transporter
VTSQDKSTDNFRSQSLYSAFYAAKFTFLGVQLPYFSAWLALKDFSIVEIGFLNGAAFGLRMVLGPLFGLWADRQTDQRLPFRLASALFVLGALGLTLIDNKFVIGLSALAALFAFGVLAPLTDTAAVNAQAQGRIDYGRARAVGSAAFGVVTLAAGYLLDLYGLELSVNIMLGATLACFLLSFVMPVEGSVSSTLSLRTIPDILSNKIFLVFLLTIGLLQGSHAVYYAFSIIHWSEIGFSSLTVGCLWAVGVAAEIVFLLLVRPFMNTVRPEIFFAVSAIAVATRWAATPFVSSVYVLALLQVLHAFTFAASYIGAVIFIRRASKASSMNTAMALRAAITDGLMLALAAAVGGVLFEKSGAIAAYSAMASMGVISLFGAWWLKRNWNGGVFGL